MGSKFLSEAFELANKAAQMIKGTEAIIKEHETTIATMSTTLQIREEQLQESLKGVTDKIEIKKITDEFDNDVLAINQKAEMAKLAILQLKPDWGKTSLDSAKDALTTASLKTIEAAGNLAGRAGQLYDVAKEAHNKQRNHTLQIPKRQSILESLRKA